MIDWEGILRDDGPPVWRTAERLLGNRADADECFQETFAAAVQWVGRPGAQPVRNWRAMLIRLATAKAVDRLRQRVRRTNRETDGGDAVDRLPDRNPETQPRQRAETAEMSSRLRAALAHLPSTQADAFCLHCLEGWSYREVAEQMDTNVDHVGVLVHRARLALQGRIASILPHRMPGATTATE